MAWGDNYLGRLAVPALPPGLTYVEIAAGGDHTIARRSNDTIVAWGDNDYREVDAGTGFSVARSNMGTLHAWGNNASDKCSVPHESSFFELAAGEHHVLARRTDGAVAAWGRYVEGQCNVPTPKGAAYVELAAGGYFSLGRY